VKRLSYQAQRASGGKPLRVVGFPQGEEYVPSIRVAGKWLREFGFDFGSEAILTATEGQIVITARGGETMPIAWKALPVWERLEKIDRRLDEIEPFVAEALVEVRLAKQGRNLPGYLDQRLSSLESELVYVLTRLRNRVESTRKAIPADAIERERNAVPQAELQLSD